MHTTKRIIPKIIIRFALFLMIIAVFYIYFGYLEKEINLANAFSLSSTLTVFATIFWWLWDKWLWRWPVLKLLSGIPDFSGRWVGYYKRHGSESDNQEHSYVLEIRQTYSSIQCTTYQESGSSSAGVIAELCTQPDGRNGLIFYWNGIKSSAEKSTNLPSNYKGVTILTYSKPIKNCKARLSGDYFTDRGTNGNVEVNFANKKLLERFDIPKDTPSPVTK